MAASYQLRQIAALPNLQLAWLRLRTTSERLYRDYVRQVYRAFGLAEGSRLDAIREALLNHSYDPSPTTKLYFPKSTGLQRVYTLLSVEDHIVYQAFANVIADKLYRRMSGRYNKSVFGHLYAGPQSQYFYQNWRKTYGSFTAAMKRAHREGYGYSASFDLTACYDSIDHDVLAHFLRDIGIQPEVIDILRGLLKKWTASSVGTPIYHGHGIPQGPVPSGLLAEVVLRHFDRRGPSTGVKYFRYVDDVRLFAKGSEVLRNELRNLDVKSKEIGLFPQGSKLEIHRVTNISDEIKEISIPSVRVFPLPRFLQIRARKKVEELTRRLKVPNVTQFKYHLGVAEPTNSLAIRVIRILAKEPSLYEPICRYLSRCGELAPKPSALLLDILPKHDIYPGFASAILRTARESTHPNSHLRLFGYCRSRLAGRRYSKAADVRAAAGAALLWHKQLSYPESRKLLQWKQSWWLRAWVPAFLQPDHIGLPSFQAIIHELLCDSSVDVALVASELTVTHRLDVPKPIRQMNMAAQHALRDMGRIGRVTTGECPISIRMQRVLGRRVKTIAWRDIFDRRTYRLMIPRVSVWASYFTTDATAWVVMTDTINDILLNAVFRNDPSLGSYSIGSIGSVLQPTGRLAKALPQFFRILARVHRIRLEADLAHPVTRSTNAPTRRVLYGDVKKLVAPLADGYLEVWSNW